MSLRREESNSRSVVLQDSPLVSLSHCHQQINDVGVCTWRGAPGAPQPSLCMSALSSSAYCPSCDDGVTSPIGSSCEVCGTTIVKRTVTRQGQGGASAQAQAQAQQQVQQQQQQQQVQVQRVLLDALLSSQSGVVGSLPPSAASMLLQSSLLSQFVSSSASPGPPVGGGLGDLWETPPPEAMLPQHSHQSSGRATSKACLSALPRIVVDSRSAVLHSAVVSVVAGGGGGGGASSSSASASSSASSPLLFEAVVAEFGREPKYDVPPAELVLAVPKCGSGADAPKDGLYDGKIVVFERGGGITFAMKAVEAERRGAVGVIVLQNVAVWP